MLCLAFPFLVFTDLTFSIDLHKCSNQSTKGCKSCKPGCYITEWQVEYILHSLDYSSSDYSYPCFLAEMLFARSLSASSLTFTSSIYDINSIAVCVLSRTTSSFAVPSSL